MADAVVVTPKPANESSVIRNNTKIAWWSGLAVVIPTAIEIFSRLLSEPAVVAWLVNYFPYQMRLVVVAIIGIALRTISDRKKTTAPIADTPAAQSLLTVKAMNTIPPFNDHYDPTGKVSSK